MMTKTFKAWAIDTGSHEGHGLIGRYYFRNMPQPEHAGCHFALFKTRDQAKQFADRVRGDGMFKKANVVRVTVSISAVGRQ